MPGAVHYETAERIATITLDNPGALNAFDHGMCLELERIWADVEANPDVACAIVTGAGEKAFCTGWDVSSLATGESTDLVPGDRWSAPYGHITALQNRCWKPVITAVNGVCNGGGLHFIADTELVLAAEHASFLDTHVAVGLASALESAGLARRIPLERVFRLALLGKRGRMTAQEALSLGLVGEVVPSSELMSRARETAAILAEHSPTALARSKRAIWESLDHGLNDGLDAAHRQVERHLGHPDPIEGAKAFLEKRPARWAPYRGTD
ncbi:MAG: enoyl-CoA hydratase/isomerase family protein [Myxococcota bacterium]|nr:enoyl-CoA hydratase/isomerase family protein [Myxococcota bacterium]